MDKKVLIIDDSPVDASLVRDLLVDAGINVSIAVTAAQGHQMALSTIPDLIVLDLILPDMSGFQLCTRLKKESTLNRTIIVIMSCKDKVEDINQGFHSGADDYIIKPPELEYLAKKLKLYLGMR